MRKYNNISLQVLAVAIGFLLMAAKFAAWWITNSNAILTDAMESIINVVAGSFALFSLIIAAKPKDQNHPYGHGKIEFLSAGFEGAMILLAGLSIVAKSIFNLIQPQAIDSLDIGILLTALAGLVNFILGYLLRRRGHKSNSITLVASGQHLLSDAWTSLGLIVGLIIVWLTDLVLLDSVIALLFSLIIIYTGFGILRRSLAGIMDEADYELIKKIIDVFNRNRRDPWIDVHNLRVIKYGATLHIDCHLTLPWYFDTRMAHDEVKKFEKVIEAHSSRPVELFIHVDPCLPAACPICEKKDCTVRQQPRVKHIEWTMENVMQHRPHWE